MPLGWLMARFALWRQAYGIWLIKKLKYEYRKTLLHFIYQGKLTLNAKFKLPNAQNIIRPEGLKAFSGSVSLLGK